MASTSDVASTSRATSLNSSPISSLSPTVEDIPKSDTAKPGSDVRSLRTHIWDKGFQCKVRFCDYCCFTDEQWEHHYYHYHRQLQFPCTEQPCGFRYFYVCELFLHVMKVHRRGRIYCKICITPLSTKVDYKHHALLYHSEYFSEDSEEESRLDSTPDPHLDFNLDQEDLLNLVDDNQRDLLPSRVRLREPAFRCFLCTPHDLSIFLNFIELLKHHKEKHSEFYPCPVCPAVYSSLGRLNLHKKVHYISPDRLHCCKRCYLKFTCLSELEDHFFDIHKKRLHECGQCEKSFKNKKALNSHTNKKHGHYKQQTHQIYLSNIYTN